MEREKEKAKEKNVKVGEKTVFLAGEVQSITHKSTTLKEETLPPPLPPLPLPPSLPLLLQMIFFLLRKRPKSNLEAPTTAQREF